MLNRPFAIVTGASSGIGLELATICAQEGFDLLVAADRPEIDDAGERFQALGANVTVVEADLATLDGVDELWEAAEGRPIDVLVANAGQGLGGSFLDQDFNKVRHVLDTNVTGTIYLVQLVGQQMRSLGRGRILLSGSIAGFMPGAFHAAYNGTKAFIESFSAALRAELKDSGVTVTCLTPGTTEIDPGDMARAGFDAMMRGDADVVADQPARLDERNDGMLATLNESARTVPRRTSRSIRRVRAHLPDRMA